MTSQKAGNDGVIILDLNAPPKSNRSDNTFDTLNLINQVTSDTTADWGGVQSHHKITSFSISEGSAKGDWTVFTQFTQDHVMPPRIRIILAEGKSDKFDPSVRHTTLERMPDGQYDASNPELIDAIGAQARAQIALISATATFAANGAHVLTAAALPRQRRSWVEQTAPTPNSGKTGDVIGM